MSLLPELEDQLRRAAAAPEVARRRRRRRWMLTALALPLSASAAWAAGELLPIGSPIKPERPPKADEWQGVPVRDGVRIIATDPIGVATARLVIRPRGIRLLLPPALVDRLVDSLLGSGDPVGV